MEEKWFERILIAAAIIGVAVLVFANVAYAAATVCQIGNGCTGTSTAPSYGKVLVGDSNGNYELTATSSLGYPVGGSGTVTSAGASTPNSTLTVGGTNPVTGSGTITFDLNLANSNSWTASTTFTKVINAANASSSLNTFGTVWNTGITSALGLFNASHQETAYGGSNCSSHQYASSVNGAGVLTCTQITLTTDVTGTLPLANGGTGLAAAGASSTVLTTNGTTNAWQLLNLGAAVYGILPIANGGTATSTGGNANGIEAYNSSTITNFPGYTLTSTGLTAANASTTNTSVSGALEANGQITANETLPATSTAITLNWAATGPQIDYQIGTSATTITLITATTSPQAGSRKLVWICNPATASAGVLTWVGVEWVGSAPSQTTTKAQCDVYSFDVTEASSTTGWKVAGTQGAGFQ
jgi:hypothetical protein